MAPNRLKKFENEDAAFAVLHMILKQIKSDRLMRVCTEDVGQYRLDREDLAWDNIYVQLKAALEKENVSGD